MTEACTLPLAPLTGRVIDAALRVHTRLGPGLLESAYKACLLQELKCQGLVAVPETALPIEYDGVQLEIGYRIDLLVERRVVVEVKTVSKLLPVHDAQILSYLKLGGFPVGLLLNFHAFRLRDGMKRFVNGAR